MKAGSKLEIVAIAARASAYLSASASVSVNQLASALVNQLASALVKVNQLASAY
jgi:hypothetical protein